MSVTKKTIVICLAWYLSILDQSFSRPKLIGQFWLPMVISGMIELKASSTGEKHSSSKESVFRTRRKER